MKRTFRLIVFAILTVVAGILLYQWWKSRNAADTRSLVPNTAVLVTEIHSLPDWLQNNRKKAAWTTLSSLPFLQTLYDRLDSLGTISRVADRSLADFLKERTVTVSVHVTAREDFDFLFYVPLHNTADQDWLRTLLNYFEKHPAYTSRAHYFQGMRITEVSARNQSQVVFSYLVHDHHFIGSYTPFLIEDAVRAIEDQSLLAQRPTEWVRLPQTDAHSENPAKIFVNMTRLGQWATTFTSSSQQEYFRQLSSIAQQGGFSFQCDKNQIRLNGRLYTDPEQNNWLDIFKEQPGHPMGVSHLIPNETAMLVHYSFENARQVFDALETYAQRHDPEWIRLRKEVRHTYDIQLSPLYDWIGREMALAWIARQSGSPGRLLILSVKDPDKAISQLGGIAAQASRMNARPAYLERYHGATIRQLDIPDFPYTAFGNLFSGFSQCYYTLLKGHMIMADEVSALKRVLDQIAAGEVWSHSVRYRSLRQGTNPEANFSVYAHTASAWPLFLNNLSPYWREQFTRHRFILRSFEQLSLQVTQRNGFHEANLVLDHPHDTSPLVAENQYLINQRVAFDRPLRTQAYVVRNPADQSNEWLVQDDANQLHFVSGTGKRIGQKMLDAPLVSAIHQIDLHQDGQKQFLFATERSLCLLDRQGHWLKGFPVTLPAGIQLLTLAVLNEDQNKGHRFVVSDAQGHLYMFDQHGTLQNGWNPRSMGYPLSAPLRHLRVSGQDYLLVSQKNGVINALNIRGESHDGFPISLKTRISSPVVVSEGASPESTQLTLLTDDGELIQLDLLGKIKKRSPLARPSPEATFRLCPEISGKGWVILRQAKDKVSLLGNPPFEFFDKGVDPSQAVICQYYDFGPDRKVFALTYPNQKRTQLYDATGTPIGDRPIENQFPVSVMYSEVFNKILIFRTSGQEAGIWTVKVR